MPIFLSTGSFLITIPIDHHDNNECDREDEVTCVSGATLSDVTDNAGCEV